ncbi:MAG: ribbon-helix-helix domain-containing protein [Thermoplasmatota archaeon]
MATTQLNIRTPEELLEQLDQVVDLGLFKTRTEAVNEAIRLLVRRYRIMIVTQGMDDIASSNLGEGPLSDTLKELREEEDL